tara:strand:+ start:341 stop:625 length:285 start_codon:yes stop_codon:yes gene_type:complete
MTQTQTGYYGEGVRYLRARVNGRTIYLQAWKRSTLAGRSVYLGILCDRMGSPKRDRSGARSMEIIDAGFVTKTTTMHMIPGMGFGLAEGDSPSN